MKGFRLNRLTRAKINLGKRTVESKRTELVFTFAGCWLERAESRSPQGSAVCPAVGGQTKDDMRPLKLPDIARKNPLSQTKNTLTDFLSPLTRALTWLGSKMHHNMLLQCSSCSDRICCKYIRLMAAFSLWKHKQIRFLLHSFRRTDDSLSCSQNEQSARFQRNGTSARISTHCG